MSAPGSLRGALRGSVSLAAAVAIAGCASGRGGAGSDEDGPSRQVGIGYGTQSRDEVTGAVGSVSAEDVTGQEVTRIEDLINGRFSGVTVEPAQNGGISIRIRGPSSFMGSGEPLYVVDGMALAGTGGGLAGVNPRDIVRIDILKDAGSTAIYGSRGANGVVLITTRRAE